MAAAVATTSNHHIVLSNPFSRPLADSDDETSSNDSSMPNTSSTVQQPSSLRAQLNHLLPRHAFFHVVIVVHQITNIPLVSGEFAVKWKFKNAYNAPGTKSSSGILGLVRKRHKAPRDSLQSRGVLEGQQDTTAVDEAEILESERGDSGRTTSIDGQASTLSGKSSSSSSSSFFGRTATTSKSGSLPYVASASASSSSPTMPPLPTSLLAGSALASSPPLTPAHGQTPFLRLKDHNVSWEYTLSVLVRMDVDRDPQSMLLSCPLKLVILQRDPLKPEARPTRYGIVNLDLAQYACKGEVSRRYLLRESKTNATLKLSTHLSHLPTINSSPSAPSTSSSIISSTTSSTASTTSATNAFTAPPLPNGEILNGISNILSGNSALGIVGENDVYRARPRGLDLYGPYYDQEDLELDLLGRRVTPPSPTEKPSPIAQPSTKSTAKNKRIPRSRSRPELQAAKDEQSADVQFPPRPPFAVIYAADNDRYRGRERSSTLSFDPSRLPLAYGPKTTETLIEALFNPVPTTHATRESPFTVYIPQDRNPSSSSSRKKVAGDMSTGLDAEVSSTPTSFINTSSTAIDTSVRPMTATTSPMLSSEPLSSKSGTSTPTPMLDVPTMSLISFNSSATSTSPAHTLKPRVSRTPTSASLSKARKSKTTRPKSQRGENTGIGAGLGIMGLGMGMGVGMGVSVGVSSAETAPGGENINTLERPELIRQARMDENLANIAEKEKGKGMKAWFKKTLASNPPAHFEVR